MTEFKEHPVTSVDEVKGFFRTGKVEGVKKWTETHFSSTTTSGGGSGYVPPGGGYVSNPSSSTTTSSTVTEVLGFFLDYGDNNEEECKLKGGKFGARDGHTVSVIRVGPKGENWGYNVAYYNHSTSTGYAPDYTLTHPLGPKPSKLMLWLAPIGGLIVGLTMSLTIGLILAAIALGFVIKLHMKASGEYRALIEAVRVCRDEQIAAAKAAYAVSQAKDEGTVIDIAKEQRA